MAEEQPGKRTILALPLFGESLESDILSEHNAAEVAGPLQQCIVRQFLRHLRSRSTRQLRVGEADR